MPSAAYCRMAAATESGVIQRSSGPVPRSHIASIRSRNGLDVVFSASATKSRPNGPVSPMMFPAA